MAARIDRAQGRARGVVVAWLTLVLMVPGSVGCERDPIGRDGTLSANEFIEIVVALRAAQRELEQELELDPDSAVVEYEVRKGAILERYDASEADLHEFMERHHARPGLMPDIWDSIAQRLRAPPEDLRDLPVPDVSH